MISTSATNVLPDITRLNDPKSETYKKLHERTRKYIEQRLQKCRMKEFRDKTGLINEDGIEGIAAHLSDTMGTNLIKKFFRFPGINSCESCGVQPDKPLDRAHCNYRGCHRPALLKRAIEYYYVDEKTPVISCQVMRKFIELHGEAPLYMLCKNCHCQYDK